MLIFKLVESQKKTDMSPEGDPISDKRRKKLELGDFASNRINRLGVLAVDIA